MNGQSLSAHFIFDKPIKRIDDSSSCECLHWWLLSTCTACTDDSSSCALSALMTPLHVHCLHWWLLSTCTACTDDSSSCALSALMTPLHVHCLHWWLLFMSTVCTDDSSSCALSTLMTPLHVHCLHWWLFYMCTVCTDDSSTCSPFESAPFWIVKIVIILLAVLWFTYNPYHLLNTFNICP